MTTMDSGLLPHVIVGLPRVGRDAAPLVERELRCPVPSSRQVFAIGLDYRSLAEESGVEGIGTIRNRCM